MVLNAIPVFDSRLGNCQNFHAQILVTKTVHFQAKINYFFKVKLIT